MRAQIFLQPAAQQTGPVAVHEPQRRVAVEHRLVDPLIDFGLCFDIALTAHVELRLRVGGGREARLTRGHVALGTRRRAAAPVQLGFWHGHAHRTDRDQRVLAEIFGHDAFLIERRDHDAVADADRLAGGAARPAARRAVETQVAAHVVDGARQQCALPGRHALPRASAAERGAPLEFGAERAQRLGQPRFSAIGQIAPLAVGRFGFAPCDFGQRV